MFPIPFPHPLLSNTSLSTFMPFSSFSSSLHYLLSPVSVTSMWMGVGPSTESLEATQGHTHKEKWTSLSHQRSHGNRSSARGGASWSPPLSMLEWWLALSYSSCADASCSHLQHHIMSRNQHLTTFSPSSRSHSFLLLPCLWHSFRVGVCGSHTPFRVEHSQVLILNILFMSLCVDFCTNWVKNPKMADGVVWIGMAP